MVNRREIAGALGALTLMASSGLASSARAASIGEAGGDNQIEPTIERIKRTKTVRIAALPGEPPFFFKDIATGAWSGIAISMALDIAKPFDAELEYVESTYGNSVLDLQSNKVDVAFALQPTPARALAIGFSQPYYNHPFGIVGRKDFHAKTWADLNKPEVRLAVAIGSTVEPIARRFAPKAQLTSYKSADDNILAVQSGRADCIVVGAIQGLGMAAKTPVLGKLAVVHDPVIALPSSMGIRMEADQRWKSYLDNWVLYNRGVTQFRDWFIAGLTKSGVSADDIPEDGGF
jgi:polar amino acid transport system substrate-binding protein